MLIKRGTKARNTNTKRARSTEVYEDVYKYNKRKAKLYISISYKSSRRGGSAEK